MWGGCVRGQGKPNPGVDHDAIGEWKRWDPPTHPGYLGGASMARVNDGKLKGVLHFGGLLFPPNQPIGGARGLSPVAHGARLNGLRAVRAGQQNATYFWPETSCP